MSMANRVIVQGETYSLPFTLVDENGTVVDMSVATRLLSLRIRVKTSTSVTDTKLSTSSDDCTWTTQASGIGSWKFTTTETAAMAVGEYTVDVLYTDTASTPTTKHVVGQARWTVVAPDVYAL